MKKKAEFKIPGGKLVKVTIDVEESKIADIMITGDFFMHPEEEIDNLESHLKGISTDENNVKQAINDFFRTKNVELIGAKPEDLLYVIMKAIKE